MEFSVIDINGDNHKIILDGRVEYFINADCMDALKNMPDKCIDLSIVDPPYGIGEDGRKNKSRGKLVKATEYKPIQGNDKEPPSKDYFDELIRVSKNQIIWGANHFISKIPYDSPCWIVWDKCNGKADFADCELAWTSFKSAVRQFRFMWAGFMQGKSIEEGWIQQGNKKLNEKRIHPNQKPVALYRWLLRKYAKPGDLILDTHVGSASSLIACIEEGFNYVGFEKDPYYWQAANKRLNDYKAQLNIFDLETERREE